MNIPAEIVIEKMEEELQRLKAVIEEQPSSPTYREHAATMKSYCELLLSSEGVRTQEVPKVQHASVADVRGKDEAARVEKQPAKRKQSIYDDGDEPQSDSLFDF
ncbi:YwdI family protein [Bacillus shivajii]|uniref:YwdI family protein n=1 Tax=Bacillus shivajii TaxID=1983719 RepID=UPI001CFAD7BA|nr:YwdI family protein [Bacillus shivajii]UCZ53089.1 YwdI family protein [Bacillus shivajii]